MKVKELIAILQKQVADYGTEDFTAMVEDDGQLLEIERVDVRADTETVTLGRW
jgi:hypothetical protein